MGPIAFDQGHDGRLKKCSEKRLTCNESQDNTDGCCAIVACRYCVTWEEYGEAAVSDMTDNGAGTWTATPGGITFVMTWQRDQYTDECELVVTFDGEEVYRQPCYDQSCRDSSDEVEVDTGYLVGTLRWVKDLKRPLPNVRDYETNCIRQMCADCNCTCECLCVTITEYDGTPIATGEMCDTAYDCDPPVWEGTVGDYEIVIALDEECVLTATVNGYAESIELEQYTSVCDNFTATITLDDGTIITVTCKECTCVEETPCISCCGGNYPQTTLYATFTLLNVTPMCACLDGLVITLTYQGFITNDLDECEAFWSGRASTGCPLYAQLLVNFICAGSIDGVDGARLEISSDTGPGTPGSDFINGDFSYYFSDCDPFEYCIRSNPGWARDCGDASVDEDEPEIEVCISQ